MPIILDGTKGETFPSWTTGTRPATPNTGQTGYNTTLNTLEVYNGTTWEPLSNGPAFSAYAGAGTSIPNTSATKIAFNTTEFDTNSNYSTANSRFTVTIPGIYQISATINFGGYYAYANPYIYKNNALSKTGYSGGTTNSSSGANYGVSAILNLVAGDYIEIFVNQSSGGTVTSASGQTNTYFQGFFVRNV
jgi:hypothetical protein